MKIFAFFCAALLAFLCCLVTFGLFVVFKIDPQHILHCRCAGTKRPNTSTTTSPLPTTKPTSVESFTANEDVNDQYNMKPIIRKEQDMKDETENVVVNAEKPMKIGKEEKVEMENEGTIFEEVEEEEEIVVKKKKTTIAPNNKQ